MSDVESKLEALGLTLPAAPKPVASYLPAVRTGNLIVVSGQLPLRDGKLLATGPVPSVTSIEQAQAAARQCVLNMLAIVQAELGGDLSKIARVVRIGVFVCSDSDFTEQHVVANGASDFLQELLGEVGRHARAAVGVPHLPLGASVEIEFLVEAGASP